MNKILLFFWGISVESVNQINDIIKEVVKNTPLADSDIRLFFPKGENFCYHEWEVVPSTTILVRFSEEVPWDQKNPFLKKLHNKILKTINNDTELVVI